MGLDLGLAALLVGFRMPLLTQFFTSVTFLGSIVFGFTLCGGLLLISREYGIKAFLGVSLSSGVTHFLKLLFEFSRPPVERLVEVMTYSFPSGHATVAFSLAVILTDIDERLKYYTFTLAVLVGFSRIYLGVHHFADVVAGAFIGYIVSRILLRKLAEKKERN